MAPGFGQSIHPALLRDTGNLPLSVPLRAYHPLWGGFPADFGLGKEGVPGPSNPTSLLPFRRRFGLFSAVFGRPYSRHREAIRPLLSLPAGTKMFCFPAFPFPCGNVRRQDVPFGNPGFKGCVRLPRAYPSLPGPSSAPEPSHPPGDVE